MYLEAVVTTYTDTTPEQQTSESTVESTGTLETTQTATLPPDVANSAVKITLPEFTIKMVRCTLLTLNQYRLSPAMQHIGVS